MISGQLYIHATENTSFGAPQHVAFWFREIGPGYFREI